jgi:hypothetical protein
VVYAEIKIVGAVSDENALEEIENIAKVFAYERRMKDYTPLLRPTYEGKMTESETDKKSKENGKPIETIYSRIQVKGLS